MPISILVPIGDHYALQVGARVLQVYYALILSCLLVSFRDDSIGKQQQKTTKTTHGAGSEMPMSEQKCPLGDDK